MGTMLPPPAPDDESEQRLFVEVHGTAPIERVDFIRSGKTASFDGEGKLDLQIERSIPRLKPGEYHYVRVVQKDEGAAWSSPIFVGRRPSPPEPKTRKPDAETKGGADASE